MAAARTRTEGLEWHEIDTDNLSAPVAKLFKAYRIAQDAANDARMKLNVGLEKALRSGGHVPEQMHCVIGYKWGKISYAVSENEGRTRGSSKSKITV